MSKTVSKRQIVFFGLVIALGAALYVNWYYTRPVNEIQQSVQAQTTAEANLGRPNMSMPKAGRIILQRRNSIAPNR